MVRTVSARLSAIFNRFENPDAVQESKKTYRPLPSVDLGRLKEKFAKVRSRVVSLFFASVNLFFLNSVG